MPRRARKIVPCTTWIFLNTLQNIVKIDAQKCEHAKQNHESVDLYVKRGVFLKDQSSIWDSFPSSTWHVSCQKNTGHFHCKRGKSSF